MIDVKTKLERCQLALLALERTPLDGLQFHFDTCLYGQLSRQGHLDTFEETGRRRGSESMSEAFTTNVVAWLGCSEHDALRIWGAYTRDEKRLVLERLLEEASCAEER
jgi:hypothetical protein